MITILEIWIVLTVFGVIAADWMATNADRIEPTRELTEEEKEGYTNAVHHLTAVKEFKGTIGVRDYFLLMFLVNTILFPITIQVATAILFGLGKCKLRS
jgi:hypothetical protein